MASISKDLKDLEKERLIQRATIVTGEFLAEEVWDRKTLPKYHVKYFDGKSSEEKDRIDLGETDSKGTPIVYVPVDNAALRKGLVILPSEPRETTFKEVFEKTDSFAFNCYDPCGKEFIVKLLNRVVIGSWFLDRFVENPEFDIAGSGKFAPIIPIRGPSQSGKNRLAFVLRLLSYRPFFEMSTYRIPSLFRPVDLWGGTLVLDEADFNFTNEKSELIHYLNCRATGTPISRQNSKNPNKTDVFSSFGQTILTQRRVFDDNATESRCLPYYSEVTGRKLPTVETDDMLREGLELQNMLFFLRLEYFREVRIDKTAWLPEINDPRLVASLLPLLALSKFEPTIKDTIKKTVKDIARLKVEQKANSEDGVLINTLWEKESFAKYSGLPGHERYFFQHTIQVKDEDTEGEHENTIPLTISSLAEELRTQSRDVRKILNSLSLCGSGQPRVIKVGNKNYRVIWFEPSKFEKRLSEFVVDYEPWELYGKLGLPKPGATLATDATDKTCGSGKPGSDGIDKYLGQPENQPHAGSVACVAAVAEKKEAEEKLGPSLQETTDQLNICLYGKKRGQTEGQLALTARTQLLTGQSTPTDTEKKPC